MILKPAKNVRLADPRCCLTCVSFRHSNNGWSECTRPDGPSWDTGDQVYVQTVCDRWKSYWKTMIAARKDTP